MSEEKQKTLSLDEFEVIRKKRQILYKTLIKFLDELDVDKGSFFLVNQAHFKLLMATSHFDQILMSISDFDRFDKESNKNLVEQDGDSLNEMIVHKIEFKDFLPKINEWVNLLSDVISGNDNNVIRHHFGPLHVNLIESSWCVDTICRKMKKDG